MNEKGRGHPLNPKHCGEPSSNIRSATLTSTAMSLAARGRARVSNTCPQTLTVDANDSKAAAVLSNLVSQRVSPMSTNLHTFEAPQLAHCRRSSRLLQFFRNENSFPHSPSSSIVHIPPANQVNLLELVSA